MPADTAPIAEAPAADNGKPGDAVEQAPVKVEAPIAEAPVEAPVAEAPATLTEQAPAPAVQAAPATFAPPPVVYSADPKIPAGTQEIHQNPDASYVTVNGGQVRYYIDGEGHVTDVRLPGVDTAPDTGRSLAVVQAEQEAQQPADQPPSPPASSSRGYCGRCGGHK
jgi:hypothetical protein